MERESKRDQLLRKTNLAPPPNSGQLRSFSRASCARVFAGPRGTLPHQKGSSSVGGRWRSLRTNFLRVTSLPTLKKKTTRKETLDQC